MTAGPPDPNVVPPGLPVPVDDGAADHLRGMAMPPIALPSTRGDEIRVDEVPAGLRRLVLYAYPMTGAPGADNPPGWDDIPGARGCTPESCGFRDHAGQLGAAGAAVLGLSTQSTAYQQEAAQRLRLPFPLLSDADLRLTTAMNLPAFTTWTRPQHDGGGTKTLLKRLTLVVRPDASGEAVVEHVFYPVFPPGEHAAGVLAWLTAHPA